YVPAHPRTRDWIFRPDPGQHNRLGQFRRRPARKSILHQSPGHLKTMSEFIRCARWLIASIPMRKGCKLIISCLFLEYLEEPASTARDQVSGNLASRAQVGRDP